MGLFISCVSNRWCVAINKMLQSTCLKAEYIYKDNIVFFFTIHEKNLKKKKSTSLLVFYIMSTIYEILYKNQNIIYHS